MNLWWIFQGCTRIENWLIGGSVQISSLWGRYKFTNLYLLVGVGLIGGMRALGVWSARFRDSSFRVRFRGEFRWGWKSCVEGWSSNCLLPPFCILSVVSATPFYSVLASWDCSCLLCLPSLVPYTFPFIGVCLLVSAYLSLSFLLLACQEARRTWWMDACGKNERTCWTIKIWRAGCSWIDWWLARSKRPDAAGMRERQFDKV